MVEHETVSERTMSQGSTEGIVNVDVLRYVLQRAMFRCSCQPSIGGRKTGANCPLQEPRPLCVEGRNLATPKKCRPPETAINPCSATGFGWLNTSCLLLGGHRSDYARPPMYELKTRADSNPMSDRLSCISGLKTP
jgi:hypothetical protein